MKRPGPRCTSGPHLSAILSVAFHSAKQSCLRGTLSHRIRSIFTCGDGVWFYLSLGWFVRALKGTPASMFVWHRGTHDNPVQPQNGDPDSELIRSI